MAKGNETTTKFKVDISDLKKAMTEARKQVAYANSEFKAASSSVDDWSKSSDGISAKLKQLNSNLKSQEKVLAEYEWTLEEVKKEYGENSKEALEYATKLNNQKAVVNKLEKEISGFEDALQEVSEAEKEAAKTGKSVSDVLEDMKDEAEDAGDGFTVLKGAVATFAGNAMSSLVGSLRDGVKSLANLASETREYREDLAKLETAYKTAGLSTEDATKVYKDFYAVLGEEDRSVEAVSHLAKFADTQEDLTKWTTIATGVWGTFGDSLPIEGLTEAANETMKTGKLTGSLADALNWAGVNEDSFQASLDNCSTEQERQALITNTLNGLYSEAANNYRETNKSIMEANKANSDYTDTMAALGAKIEPITTSLKQGFNELLQEVLKLVEDVDMAAFQAKVEEAFRVLKEDVLPAVKAGFSWILDNKDTLVAGLAAIAAGFVAFKVASLIQTVSAAMQGMTLAQYALNLAMSLNPIGIIVSLIAALVAAFVTLWNKCEGFRNFFTGLWEGLKNIVGGVVNAIGGFFSGLWDGIKNIFGGIGNWFKEKFTAAKENSAQAWENSKELFSKVKDKVTGAFSNIGNWFKEKFTQAKENSAQAWENATELFGKVKDKVTGAFSNIGNWFKEKFTQAKENSANAWENATELFGKVKNKVTGVFSNIGNWFKEKFSQAKENSVNAWSKAKENFTAIKDKVTGAFGNLGSDLKNKFSEALERAKSGFSKAKSIGSDIVKGLWNGIKDMTGWVIEKIQGFGESVLGGIKDFFGIHSPSKVMADEVGKWLPAGIAVGIDKNAKSALSAMKDLAVNTVGAASAGLKTATAATGGSIGAAGGVVNNFTQIINSPKQLSRLDIYRQSKNLLGYAGGGV